MPFRLDIEDDGKIDEIADRYQAVSRRSKDLRPIAGFVQGQWLGSERRLFEARPWRPKSASTRRRYRWTIRPFSAPYRRVRVDPAGPTLRATGHLQDTLTRANEPGQLLRRRSSVGSISITVGLRPKGDAIYGAFLKNGGRDPLSFDDRAVEDTTGDLVDWLLEGDVRDE